MSNKKAKQTMDKGVTEDKYTCWCHAQDMLNARFEIFNEIGHQQNNSKIENTEIFNLPETLDCVIEERKKFLEHLTFEWRGIEGRIKEFLLVIT